ncbi:MAG: hypothetical protein IIB75_07470 [Proteobacteria bacterium]|nr:hypothetical protein [Pseudomonadota bacterium]
MGIFEELKRRNVFRVAVAYAIFTWLTVQIVDLVLDNISAPAWVMQVFFLMLAIGFVVALIVSWAYEITPEGIKRERDVVRDDSTTHLTARKLDYITLAAALGVVALVGWQYLGSEANVMPRASVAASATSYSTSTTARLGDQSIAVLPFANRSNREEDLFFTDGIHDDLLTQLAKISGLRVISRTSVMEYRDTTKKIRQIASELGVAKVLEGGVQRAGPRIRINAQLIDVVTDEHVWAETFDREMTIDNLFDIQSEITRQIVAAVKGQMSESDQGALLAAPTKSVPAYEAYLRGRQVLSSSGYNIEKYQEAQPLFERAVTLDPDFALAHLLLAEVHSFAAWMGYGNFEERRTLAHSAIDRATSILGADAPQILVAQGQYLYRFERDFAGALEKQTKALAAMPGDLNLRLDVASTQRRLGLWDESIANMLLAAELDPASSDARGSAASTMAIHHEFDRLAKYLPTVRARFPYDTDLASIHAMLPLWAHGDTKTARRRLDKVRPNAGLEYVQASIELPWFERDFAAAIEIWDRPEVIALTSTDGWVGWGGVYQAMAWQELGDEQRARNLLVAVANREIDWTLQEFALFAELGARAWALVLLGDFDAAIALSEQAVSQVADYESDAVEGLVPLTIHCYVLAKAGRRDEALVLLSRVLDQPGGLNRWPLYLDPRWDFFRDDERFNDMIRPHNLEQSIHAQK